MSLICLECGNSLSFSQVSSQGDARSIDLAARDPLVGEWIPGDHRDVGLYCGGCAAALDLPVPDWLLDGRVQVVEPARVDADQLATKLEAALGGAIAHRFRVPARPAVTAPAPDGLHPAVSSVLGSRFGSTIYRHQAEAIALARGGRHVVQATSAGSGKSLGFLVPVLDAILSDPKATALFVYPSKSLVSDQLLALRGWATTATDVGPGVVDMIFAGSSTSIRVGRYDGMQNAAEKTKVRRSGRIVLTTPDSLHAAVLRHALHPYRDGSTWERFLKGLRYVVLDEIHQYGGSFGTAVAMVLRRLRRTAADHGREPVFLAASATIGNPGHLLRSLLGVEDVAVVDEDGSPRSERVVLIGEVGASGSDGPATAAKVAVGGPDGPPPVRTLVFTDSRLRVDQLASKLRTKLRTLGWSRFEERVVVVRGTLDSRSRSEAEAALRDGSALVVVSTSALELGIDVASLGLAVLDGLPADAASFEQRAGRVGRSGPGVVLVLPGERPVERYLATDPDRLRGWLASVRPTVVVDVENAEAVRLYGLVPGQEEMHGVAFADAGYFGEPAVTKWLSGATGAPRRRSRGHDYFEIEIGVGERYQSLRSGMSSETFDVQVGAEATGEPGRSIGEVDRVTGMTEAYVGAIFRDSGGRPHRVTRVDFPARTVHVQPTGFDGWTRGVLETEVVAREELLPALARRGTKVTYGNLNLVYRATSTRVSSGGGTSWESISEPWPELHLNTVGLSITVDRDVFPPGDHEPAVRAVRNALISVVPMLITGASGDVIGSTAGRTVYLHDRAGRFGWSRPLHERFPELAGQAWQLVATCDCSSDGCPSCVVGPDGQPTSRSAAETLLRHLTTCWVT